MSVVAACVALLLVTSCPAGAAQRAYFADFESDSSVPFHPLGSSGQLLSSGLMPATAGTSGLESVVISPDGKRLLTGGIAGSIFNFSIDPSSGKLTAGPGPASVATAPDPYGLVITPNGKFAYQSISGPGGGIRGVSIAPNGSIAATIPGLPMAVSGGARGLAVSSDGKFLYVTEGDNEVGSYAIGPNGSLTELSDSPLMGVTSPYPISLTPDGKFAFVPGRDSTPDAFTLAVRADGSLAFLLGGYAPLPAAGNPFGSTITPDGRFYYVVNYDDGSISGFRIGNDGILTELSGSPYALRLYLTSVTSDADGSHLYVTNDVTGKVDVLAVADTGVPTPVPGSPFSVDAGAVGDFQSVALTPDQPPVANLKVSAQTPTTATLDASATSDPEGDEITYHWDFGDGEEVTSDTPKVTHDYAPGNIYFPGVIAYDDRNCGFSYKAAGQTPFCNGGRRAGASVEVSTIKPKLRARAAKRQRLGKPLKVKVSVPNVPVSVTAKATASLKGAKVKEARYKRATTDLEPGLEVLKLKLKKRAKKAEKASDRGKASITVVGDGNGYTISKELKVKLR